jgi:hypothetical protein
MYILWYLSETRWQFHWLQVSLLGGLLPRSKDTFMLTYAWSFHTACSYQCKACETTDTYCTACDKKMMRDNRVVISHTCPCKLRYFQFNQDSLCQCIYANLSSMWKHLLDLRKQSNKMYLLRPGPLQVTRCAYKHLSLLGRLHQCTQSGYVSM